MKRTLLLVCIPLGSVGCGTGDDGPRDSGFDISVPARDAGPRDGGPYCGDGICDPWGESFVNCHCDCGKLDFCRDGTEGCECTSTFTPGDATYPRDDCEDSDMLCIPWDVLSERDDVMLPAQSCVRACTTDDDCGLTDDGAPRFCAEMAAPLGAPPIGRVCVDRTAPLDAFCGGSRNTEVLVSTQAARVKTSDAIVGCPPGAECHFNALETLNPDEGVCIQRCVDSSTCPNEAPYCNPEALGPDGLCNLAPLGLGSWCRFSEDPDRAGFTSFCDNGDDALLSCLDLAVIGIPAGICVEYCNLGGSEPDAPCVSTDATQTVLCRMLDAATGDGVCVHDKAQALPDTCGGDGAYGAGRQGYGVVFGDDRIPADWCTDRLLPSLKPSGLDTFGQPALRGDDCAVRELDAYRCPDLTFCAGDGQGGGFCLAGCALDRDPLFCGDALDALGLTSTSAVCLMTGTSTVVGICGG